MEELESEWADPWEHARLLGDGTRNSVLIDLLAKHARGSVTIEIGCGTGVWSVLAARLGARQVIALEPSDLWTTARDLVAKNGLQQIVTVLPLAIEDLTEARLPKDWTGADLIFSELLNADPFAEGILSASVAARRLLAPGGVLAPDQLDLYVALAQAEAHTDLHSARTQLHELAARFDLDLDSVVDVLEEADIEPFVSPTVALRSEVHHLCSVTLGDPAGVPEHIAVALAAKEPVGGAALWWTARYDRDLSMTNAPGTDNHWGQLVCAWPEQVAAGTVVVDVELEDDSVRLLPAT